VARFKILASLIFLEILRKVGISYEFPRETLTKLMDQVLEEIVIPPSVREFPTGSILRGTKVNYLIYKLPSLAP